MYWRTTSLFTTLSAALLTTFVAGGCTGEKAPQDEKHSDEIGSQSQAIVGGQPWDGDPAAVLVQAGGICTGTLIRPNVVITAAHCLVTIQEGGERFITPASAVRVSIGTSVSPSDQVESFRASAVFAHRDYFLPPNENAANIRNDFAMIRLEEDAVTPPVDFNRIPLTNELHQDLEIRIVGFGNDFGGTPPNYNDASGAGRKRIANGLRIGGIRDEFLDVTAEGAGAVTCQGDSGGPTFGDPDGNGEVVLSVTSFGDAGCNMSASSTRTDFYVDLMDEVLAAWTGPCAADGTCVETGCGDYVDPDCDPCGLNGQCIDGCPGVDLDCPLGKLTGETCNTEFECEDRNCIAADDDPTITFCTPSCDPAGNPLTECPPPLSACEQADDGEYYCGYAGPTPRALGASCDGPSDCNSDLCDTSEGICVVPCPSDGCPEGYECRGLGGQDVCALPGGGGCSARSGTSGSLAFLVLIGLVLALRQRRKDA